ncbi:hypothetical protein DL93DRAFT_2087230 [Clavulina sp. PMI_390]|nr:hypothetical protein DL93DRAFT_2087230 [Clavulina sp. PMI_390]
MILAMRSFILSLFILPLFTSAAVLESRATVCANISGLSLTVLGKNFGVLSSGASFCVCASASGLSAFIKADATAAKAARSQPAILVELTVAALVLTHSNRHCTAPPSARKRSPAELARSEHRCQPGLSKCGIYSSFPSSLSSRVSHSQSDSAYECLDTQSNLESCGGCVVPYTYGLTPSEIDDLPAAGVDCTALPNVSDVECRVGRCVVHRCKAGSRRVPVLQANGEAWFECVSDSEGAASQQQQPQLQTLREQQAAGIANLLS